MVELRSPGDDTYDKLSYYHRLGVGEVLIVHPAARALELRRRTASGWDEVEPAADGWIALAGLPVALRTGSGPVLEVRTTAPPSPRPHRVLAEAGRLICPR